MHPPPYFVEIAALAFALSGAFFAWLTRWHVLLAAFAGTVLLFVVQFILHVMADDTVSLLVADGPLVFYAGMSLVGTIPAVVGASLVRIYKRWRNK